MSLDKKYRPKTFEDVIGQDGIIKVLKKTLMNLNNVTPSIFHGPFGSGKTTLGRIYARSILCQNRKENLDPCNTCESCQMFFKDTHPGYTEIDGANLTKVEDFRKVLESTSYQVSGSQYRVFLIDECHMMSTASQNLFLKPLEEGIPGVFWFFCTTEYTKIIETIQSRCTDFGIRPIPLDGISQRVIDICKLENIPYEEEAVKALVNVKKGHFRDVLVFFGQVRDIGGLTVDVIYDYLDIGVNDEYFKILTNLKDQPSLAMDALDRVLTRITAQEAYNGISIAAMDAFKADQNIKCSLVVRDKTIREKVFSIYGGTVTSITNYLLNNGNRRIDKDYLISTLLLMREKLTLGLKLNSDVIIKETIHVTNTTPNIPTQKVEVLEKPKIKPLTNMDDKGKRRSTNTAAQPTERIIAKSSDEHDIVSDKDFSILFQRGV